jgi:fructoselysine-6-P-deglycase FrlB-like protein
VVEPIKYFRDGGATTIALVNDIDSPLARPPNGRCRCAPAKS